MSDEFVEQSFVFTGRVNLQGGKVGASLALVVDEDRQVLGEERYFEFTPFKKAVRYPIVGGIYKIAAADRQIRPASASYQRRWPNREQIAAWELQDKTLDVEKAMRKDSQHKEVLKVLEPLRKAYRKTNLAGQIAMEAQVLAYLRGYDL